VIHPKNGPVFVVIQHIAINQQSEMFIQGRDGQIRERNSYGDDPFPPKG